MNPEAIARRAVALLDLTSLEDTDDEATIANLCRRAETPLGPVAAVCVYAPFVGLARKCLAGSGVRVATVVNFPHGLSPRAGVVEEIRTALAAGADEIDVVFPYRAFLAGDRDQPRDLVAAARDATGTKSLKVILETGALADSARMRDAGEIAIAAGADFLKTSTGKMQPAATLEAARTLLHTILDSGRAIGFKAAGGIRTRGDAAAYLAIADEIMGPGWAAPGTFRFGASGLLNDLLAGETAPVMESGY